MISNEYITFQKSLLNKKCEQQDTHINPFANMIFSREWKFHSYPFISGASGKSKSLSSAVSYKSEILQWFKTLTHQQKLDVITIHDKDFMLNFLKFSEEQFQNRLINFNSGYSIANLLSTGQKSLNFQQIKNYLFVALTREPMLWISCESNQLVSWVLDWLQEVTCGKCFEYANKISNKEQPEDNLLWFSSSSFQPFEAYLANQLQKSITKHYFKKDLLPNYKLKEFTQYMSSRYPQQAKFLKLTIQQARKLSKEEIDNYCNLIMNYQNSYYEVIRQSFIQSLDILQNDTRKKRKNKRKGKKKNPSSPHTSDPYPQSEQSPHKRHSKSQHERQSDDEEAQLLLPIEIESQRNQEEQCGIEKQDRKQNKSQNAKTCVCKQQTSSKVTKCESRDEKKEKGSNSKNLVTNKQRSRSPYSKSNIIDNDCSKSHFSGQLYQTFTQAVIQQCHTKGEQFQLQSYSQQINQSNQNCQLQQIKKQRRKRKNNNNNNKQVQQMARCGSSGLINRQLTNFIDSLSIETNNLYQSKIISFQRVRYFIQNLYPQTEAVLFGSNSMGLSLPSSDVDIMLYNVPRDRFSIQEILAQIAVQINTMGWVVSCSTYLNAKVPLVKLQIDPLVSYLQTKRRCDYQNYCDPTLLYYLDIKDRKKANNIYVDITINLDNNQTGHSLSTELMRSWVNADPTLQRTILVFKYILAEKGYNKNFSGGLGSYCLFIMIAAYFMEFRHTLPLDQGQIFLNILTFYSEEFENKLKSITLRENQSCFLSLEELLNMQNFSQSILSNPLRIIDPLTQKLTSSSCSQFHLIKNEFRRIKTELISQISVIEKQIVTNFTPIQPSKIQATQKSIEKWIHKYEVRNKFSIKKIIDGTSQSP